MVWCGIAAFLSFCIESVSLSHLKAAAWKKKRDLDKKNRWDPDVPTH